MSDEDPIKPDPALQKKFNAMLVIMMVVAGALFFFVEPQMFDSGTAPLLGDVYGLSDAHKYTFNLNEETSRRVAFQSDFYLAIFIGALFVSFFLPVGASRATIIKRFLQDYSVKCAMEFYLPYVTLVVFLLVGAWMIGTCFVGYEANARIGFVDAVLTKIAPFMGVLAASMIVAVIKGISVFRIVLRELGAPAPDIANVPARYILPWGLKPALFKHVIERSKLRYPERSFQLGKSKPLTWTIGLGIPALAVYNMASGDENAVPFITAAIWFVMGLVVLPITRRAVFNATKQSISLGTRIGLLACLFLLSMAMPAG